MIETKVVSCDIDGTFADTREQSFRSIQHSADRLHYPVPSESQVLAIISNPIHVCFQLLFPDGDIQSLLAEQRRYDQEYPSAVTAFPYAREVLMEIEARGFGLVAVTSRTRRSIFKLFDDLEFHDRFGLVIAVDDVKEPKPNPEGIYKALRHFNARPELSFMVGDTRSDIKAGQAANVRTIAATYGYERDVVKQAHPNHSIDSLPEILEIVT